MTSTISNAGLAVVLVVELCAFVVAGCGPVNRFLSRQIDPEYSRLESISEAPLTGEDWRSDIRHLGGELPRRIPYFYEIVDSADFAAEVHAAAGAVSESLAAVNVLQLYRLLAAPRFGGGHIGINPLQKSLGWHFYPFVAYEFDDGVYVTEAAGRLEKAVGARLTAISGHMVDDILSKGEVYTPADNASHRRLVRTSLLTIPEVLEALGVVERDRPATMTFLNDVGTEFEIRVDGLSIKSNQLMRFGRKLQRLTDDSWSSADLRPRSRSYWFEYRRREKTMYFQFNAVRNDEHESIASFSERLKRAIEAHDIERFVVDLRANGGGNNTLLEPLVEVIAGSDKLNRRGRLFVLIGRRTFSAAGNFASALERRSKAIFVGEESGFSPNMWGDTAPYKLPRTGVIIEVATRYWEDGSPGGAVATIRPHIQVPLTHEHHFSNQDPVMAAVMAYAPPEDGALREDSAFPAENAYLWGHTYLVTFSRSVGRLMMHARGDRPYVATELFEAGEGIFESDIRGVRILRNGAEINIDWKGHLSRLEPVAMDHRLPIDLLRDGSIEEALEAFRAAVARGARFDSDMEIELNRIGYELLRADSISSAIEVFRLSADLFPTSVDVHDSLGDGLKAAGQRDAAVRSYRRAVSINPLFESSLHGLRELGEGI